MLSAENGVQEEKDYNPWPLYYGRAKTANVLFSVSLAERFLAARGVASFAVDPGSKVEKTALLSRFFWILSLIERLHAVVGETNLMENTGVDAELMQQGMDMAVARNDGK